MRFAEISGDGRLSSGLITGTCLIVIVATGEVHWADDFFDERDLVLCDAILLVKQIVSSSPVPSLLWYPRVSRSQRVLGDFPKRYEKTEQASPIIAGETLSCPLREERRHDEVRLSTR